MSASLNTWQQANQRYLRAALDEIQALLIGFVEQDQHASSEDGDAKQKSETLHDLAASTDDPPALELLCSIFGLSPFERSVLLLCAGVDLDATFAPLCAVAHGHPQWTYPTFSLAMAAIPGGHWSALAPLGPLRRWQLVELGEAQTLTMRPLRINERVLHYLLGLSYIDERLSGIAESVEASGGLVPSHQAVVDRVAAIWEQDDNSFVRPIVQLCGTDRASKEDIAAAACGRYGLSLLSIRAASLPTIPSDLIAFIQLCEREIALVNGALLLNCDEAEPGDPARENAISQFLETFDDFVIVSAPQRYSLQRRPMVVFDIQKPSRSEQHAIWQGLLGASHGGAGDDAARLASHFDLSTNAINTIYAGALHYRSALSGASSSKVGDLGMHLWEDCRARTRPQLDQVAQRIEPRATWDDLILPNQQRQMLREIGIHIRQRGTVYETWGFGARSARGLGITALFSGSSGTGKTMAAEVLANELRLDLYRIDLSATVSKYIGETEKNLRRIFDAAEAGGAILLFDEADALFGRRSEVKDSHDRYANIEVSYLLQRMEAYRGLAILTTNQKSALDKAFLRRIRFVVEFPFPDAADRARIWQRIFPTETPIEALDIGWLVRLNIAGGNIRNIAMNAAFLAAEAAEPVRMRHLLSAARSEYLKLDKPLTEGGDWE
jgi:hypothetical protein